MSDVISICTNTPSCLSLHLLIDVVSGADEAKKERRGALFYLTLHQTFN